MPKWYKRSYYEKRNPKIGDIAYGDEIGKKNAYLKFTFEPCPCCSIARWVAFTRSGCLCYRCHLKEAQGKYREILDKNYTDTVIRIEKEFRYKIYSLLLDLCEEPDPWGYYYSKVSIAGILGITLHILDKMLLRYNLRPLAQNIEDKSLRSPTVFEDYCWFKLGMSPRRYIESCRWKTIEEILQEVPISQSTLSSLLNKHGITPMHFKNRTRRNTYWHESDLFVECDCLTRGYLNKQYAIL